MDRMIPATASTITISISENPRAFIVLRFRVQNSWGEATDPPRARQSTGSHGSLQMSWAFLGRGGGEARGAAHARRAGLDLGERGAARGAPRGGLRPDLDAVEDRRGVRGDRGHVDAEAGRARPASARGRARVGHGGHQRGGYAAHRVELELRDLGTVEILQRDGEARGVLVEV